MRPRPVGLLLLCLLAAVAPAAETPADAAARKAIEAFRAGFAASEPARRIAALVVLEEHPHPLVVDEIGSRALADLDPEVRRVASQLLGRMRPLADRAGPLLRDHLAKNDAHPDVLRTIVRSIGLLRYDGARKELQALLAKHLHDLKYRWVTDEVLRTLGLLRDVKSLPFLLRVYQVEPRAPGRAKPGETVRAGSDAEAKRRYEKEHGKGKIMPKGEAESLDLWWRQQLVAAIKTITGKEFEDARAFRDWLKKNAKKLGIDPRELRSRRRL